ncbi:MAG: Amino acid adenylation protein, partial [Bacteroidota bacterium]|nr:Amino acid adenylation protein [Bacteroidota bacterium]
DGSPEMAVALLGIMKSGAAYIPLDPYFPKARLEYIIKDSGIKLVFSQLSYSELINTDGLEIISLDNDGSIFSDYSSENLSLQYNSAHLAYIIYTSGSTGNPKGVMVTHRSLVNYLEWMRAEFPLNENDIVLNKTSINFDISIWEIFLPLISGAALAFGEKNELHAPESLGLLIRDTGVTVIQFVPSALKMFADSGELPKCSSIRMLFSGGEKLSRGLMKQVFNQYTGEFFNIYGPTEATIYASYWRCDPNYEQPNLPIGKPIYNTKIYILAQNLKPLPPGIAGELYIGGEAVVNGYLNMPELTAEKFLHDPFPSAENAKMYRTGDLVRLLEDGNIEYIGRIDQQVKMRGYRIELSEIEHYLNNHPAISRAIVQLRQDKEDDLRLVAYFVPSDGVIPSDSELREYLRQKLPDYMLPSIFYKLDSIPLLPNGKVNTKALPSPSTLSYIISEHIKLFSNKYEEKLAHIWEEVLGSNQFGVDDNFYDVGGHSLLMVKIQNHIKEKLNLSVSIIDLFQYPNIKSLAQHFRVSNSDGIKSIIAERIAKHKKAKKPIINQIIKENHEKF